MAIFLKAKWENIIMANYALPPEILSPYLPYGVELDLFEGKAYVSLVGFMFKSSKIFGVPIPFYGTFEEVNLRFYVKRKEAGQIKRGVVFINETVPNKMVAFLANALYKEHYEAVPTKHTIEINDGHKKVNYFWKKSKQWFSIKLNTSAAAGKMIAGSFEEFIFEHYYGYTKISETQSEEYKINHPSWNTNKVKDYAIDCDFKIMYGKDFEILNSIKPTAVFIAEGSPIEVEWKRKKIKANQ